MKKRLSVFIFLILVLSFSPVSAVWWNPFSWFEKNVQMSPEDVYSVSSCNTCTDYDGRNLSSSFSISSYISFLNVSGGNNSYSDFCLSDNLLREFVCTIYAQESFYDINCSQI